MLRRVYASGRSETKKLAAFSQKHFAYSSPKFIFHENFVFFNKMRGFLYKTKFEVEYAKCDRPGHNRVTFSDQLYIPAMRNEGDPG